MEKYRDKQWLYVEYIEKDKTVVQIAEELNVVHSTIAKWKRKHGILKPQKPSHNNTKVEIKCSQCKQPYEASLRILVRGIREGRKRFFCGRRCRADMLTTLYLGAGNPMSGRKGESNPSWKGGVSGINEFTRYAIKEWKRDILKSHNYICFITGKNSKELQVHHVTPFHEIRDKVLESLELNMRSSISEYSRDELEQITEKIIKLHENEKGYPVRKDIHKSFHRLYGFKTSEVDFLDFKKRYSLGEINAIEHAS